MPYNNPIAENGGARSTVTYGSNSILVISLIASGSCGPILDRQTALQLDILIFIAQADAFQPILMINTECAADILWYLQKYPDNLTQLGKLGDDKIKLHED